jgi:tripartite-type tricarboxylate transporter receptor subunit TctC
MVHGKKPSGLEWEVCKAFLISGFPAQKLLVLPKGTPKEIVQVYRAAVRRMKNDPEYREKRDTVIGEYEQLTDKAGEELYKEGTTISPEARQWVREFLTKTYHVQF